MAIQFNCSSCGQVLQVGDESAGQQARCPYCNEVVMVPQSGPQFAGQQQPASPYVAPQVNSPSSHYRNIPNYLVQAILVTIFCCLPFGIVAIVYAAQVGTMVSVGDFNKAMAASENAKKWCWLGFWFGLIPTILAVVIQIMAAMANGPHRF